VPPTLTLFEDVLRNGAAATLPARPRMIYVVHGSVSVNDTFVAKDEAWSGEEAARLQAGSEGVTLWRWELGSTVRSCSAPDVRSTEKLTATLDTLPEGDLLLRGDSVAFGPGGCAFLHVHQGPGIRCLIEGGIRIDVHDTSTSYGPGGAWFEAGPDAVFAQAAPDRASRFIRVMVLPRTLLGKSSIRYVDEADRDKPKSQTYKVFVDAPIVFPLGAPRAD
jgi:hypothetical protein